MVVVTAIIVVMRYVFDAGYIWLQESVVWMHAAVFMLGAAYTLFHEDHVRVDIFYRGMSLKRRGWVDLLGVVLFLTCSVSFCFCCPCAAFLLTCPSILRPHRGRSTSRLVNPVVCRIR